MDTKQQLLAYLEAHRGEYLSGETLAQQLHISRAAVWKAMGALKDAGYSILAVRNRGYCLGTDQDKLSLSGLAANLDEYGMSCQPEIQDCVTSTNALVRERAAAGARSDGHFTGAWRGRVLCRDRAAQQERARCGRI